MYWSIKNLMFTSERNTHINSSIQKHNTTNEISTAEMQRCFKNYVALLIAAKYDNMDFTP